MPFLRSNLQTIMTLGGMIFFLSSLAIGLRVLTSRVEAQEIQVKEQESAYNSIDKRLAVLEEQVRENGETTDEIRKDVKDILKQVK